jgi:hypothetical protein
MADDENPASDAKLVPGMSVMMVPVEIAEKIGELIGQALSEQDDTSAYIFRGVGQISTGMTRLSDEQVTPTGEVSATKTWFGADDTLAPDADTIDR